MTRIFFHDRHHRHHHFRPPPPRGNVAATFMHTVQRTPMIVLRGTPHEQIPQSLLARLADGVELASDLYTQLAGKPRPSLAPSHG